MSSRKGWHLIFISMQESMICSFFGHRDVAITDALYAITFAEIKKSVDLECHSKGQFSKIRYIPKEVYRIFAFVVTNAVLRKP